MAGNNKTDEVEKQKRVYQVSLMLRRKSLSFIIEYMRKEWDIEKAQAYRYIALARKEWEKYFAHLKKSGMSYHVAQLRDLKDQAYGRKVIIGRGKKKINEETGKTEMIYDNQQLITIADLGLVFEITKEEAKLMGIYPVVKSKIEVEEVGDLMDAKEKLISKINSIIAREKKTKGLRRNKKSK